MWSKWQAAAGVSGECSVNSPVRIIGAGLAGVRSRVAVRASGRRSRIVRDAAGAIDSGASDERLRGTGLLELTEIRQRKYRAVAAERRDAARGFAADGNRARMRRSRGTCAGRRSRRFSQRSVTEAISREPLIKITREEVTRIDEKTTVTIIATGPLTSDALSQEIASSARCRRYRRSPHLYFYDSISPIVEADSIDMSQGVSGRALRQGHSRLHQLPDDREEYDRFLRCAASRLQR